MAPKHITLQKTSTFKRLHFQSSKLEQFRGGGLFLKILEKLRAAGL